MPATSWDSLQTSDLWQSIMITTLHKGCKGCISAVSWRTWMRILISNRNPAVWRRFFLTVKPVLLLPICKSYKVTQRRWSMINVTQQSRLCPSSSSQLYFIRVQQCDALSTYCCDFLEQIQKAQSFASRSHRKKEKKKPLRGKINPRKAVKLSWVRRTNTFPVHCSEPGVQCWSLNARNCWLGSKGLRYKGQVWWHNTPPDLKSIKHIN